MLTTLDNVDWLALTDAYGAAVDIPPMIRGLASEGANKRSASYEEAYCKIFHQSSRYEASAVCVPYLFEILRETTVQERNKLIHLLVHLAVGYFDQWVPGGFDEKSFLDDYRAVMKYETKANAAYRKLCSDVDSGGDGGLSKKEEQLIDKGYLIWAAKTYLAVEQHAPLFCTLLNDPDADVRDAACFGLAFFARVSGANTALEAVITSPQTSSVLRANAILALAIRTVREAEDRNRALFETHVNADGQTSSPLEQLCASIALLGRPENLKSASGKKAETMLVHALRDAKSLRKLSAPLHWNGDGLGPICARILGKQKRENASLYISALCDSIRADKPLLPYFTLWELLKLAFPLQPPTPVVKTGLNQDQKLVLTTIASVDIGEWGSMGFKECLEAFGLPCGWFDFERLL